MQDHRQSTLSPVGGQRLARAVLCIAVSAIFVMALLPQPEAHVRLFSWQDKLEHFVVFFAFAVLSLFAWPRHAVWVVSGLLAYGVGIELAQSLTAYRQGSVLDFVADALGVAAAASVWAWRWRRPLAPA